MRHGVVKNLSMPKSLPGGTITFQHINEIHIEIITRSMEDINLTLKGVSPNNLGYLKLPSTWKIFSSTIFPLLKIGRKKQKINAVSTLITRNSEHH